MENSTKENTPVVEVERRGGRWLWWFVGGGALSFFALCSLVLFILVAASVGINAYLAWQLSGLELVVVRPMPAVEENVRTAPEALVVVITATPAAELSMSNPPTPLLPAATNTPLALILPPTSTPVPEVRIVTATPSPTTTLIDVEVPLNQAGNNAAARETTSQSAAAETASSAVDEGASSSGLPTFSSGGQAALTSSDNQYDLIPIKGGRDPRPAEEHGDLNLRLREPEPSQAAAELVDYTGFDDDNAPRLSAIFEPNFTSVYTVHDWDWACNCPGPLKTDGFLVAIETTPGEPIYIPKVNSDIYGGKYYAVVLYASEDSLTFVYNDVGTVADAYAVHYLGLNVDPNLLQTYRESSGDELPALTLDTPVGTANEQIIVSMRDKGTFMDTRSRKDWWD